MDPDAARALDGSGLRSERRILPDVDLISAIFSAFGLSASAGLNAYIPLLVLGGLNRWTSLIDLAEPYSLVSNVWVLSVIGVLALVEVLADNLPVVNHINDGIQTFIRPVAGAVAFAASTDAASVNPVLAVIAGLLVAGSVHTTKAVVVRPAVTVTTAGLGNTPVSVTEDILSASVSFIAIALPILIGIGILVFGWPIIRWVLRKRRKAATPG